MSTSRRMWTKAMIEGTAYNYSKAVIDGLTTTVNKNFWPINPSNVASFAVIGDSITAGDNNGNKSYIDELTNYSTLTCDFRSGNPGYNIEQLNEALKNSAFYKEHFQKYDYNGIVIVQGGTNDILQGQSTSKVQQDIRNIIDNALCCTSSNGRVLFITPIWIKGNPTSYQKDYTREMLKALYNLNEESNYGGAKIGWIVGNNIAGLNSDDSSYNYTNDNVHPNANGHLILATEIMSYIARNSCPWYGNKL